LPARVFIGRIAVLVAASCMYAADPGLRIGEAEAKRAATERVAPVYPITARQLKVTGKVVIEAVVNDNGIVSEARPLTGNPILTKPALEAVKKWKFKPFEVDGKPSAAVVTLSFEFDTK
jgi:protein TonB